MQGGSLSGQLFNQRWKPSQRQVLHVAHSIALGGAYLHSLRPIIIHRDLKSPNVLLSAAPRDDPNDISFVVKIRSAPARVPNHTLRATVTRPVHYERAATSDLRECIAHTNKQP